MAKPALGSGKRFKSLTASIEKKSGYGEKGAKAAAAMIGRKKYGAGKMAKMASAGRLKKTGRGK